MLDKYYDELRVGAVELLGSRTIAEGHSVGFAGVTALADHPGVPTGPGLVSPHQAMLAMSISTGLVPTLPGRALGIVGLFDVEFHTPVRVGDTVRASFEVVAKRDKAPGGVIEFLQRLTNQANGVLFTARMHVWLAASPTTEPARAPAGK